MGDSESASTKLSGALFNLLLPDFSHRLEAWAACMTAANLLPKTPTGAHMFLPHAEGLPDELRIVAIAYCIVLLESWGRQLTPGFYDWVSFALVSADFDVLPPELVGKIEPVYARAYAPGNTTHEEPFKRYRRLKGIGHSGGRGASADQFRNKFMSIMPKCFSSPYRTC
jgi:hypothetical protein